LNNRGLTFANRCFAFTPAAGQAEGENYGANCNQELLHEVAPIRTIMKKYRYFSIYN
jgi:hypothetical protein